MARIISILLSFFVVLLSGCGTGSSVKNTDNAQSGIGQNVKESKQTKVAEPGSSTRSISLDDLLGNSSPNSGPKVVSNSGPWKYYTGPDGTKRQDISGVEWVVLEGGKGKSLTQAMVGQKLRRYVIKGSFDLGGKTIRMPYGSVLDLESGDLRNGTIVFDDTRVTPVYAISKGNSISKVKVSGTYYETLVDLWGASDEPIFPWDTTAPKKVYTVDLKKFGITPGYQKKGSNGHYSDKQYDLMYKNGVGFTNAIQWAYKNGYDGICFPKNDYCFTPRTTKNDKPEEGPIVLVQDLDKFDIDFGGSSCYLILDSKRKSKYYSLAREKPYSQGGTLFFIAACINLQIHNGKMVGDRTLRDYDEGMETLIENTLGFFVSGYCQNIRFHHLDMSGFMGDGIMCFQSGGIYSAYDGVYQSIRRSYPKLSKPGQYIQNTKQSFTLLKGSNSIRATVTDYCSLANLYSDKIEMAFDVVNKMSKKRSFTINNNLGYTRLINPYHNVEIITFNDRVSKEQPLRLLKTSYLETIQLYENETGVKVQSLYDDGATEEGLQHSLTISELVSSNVIIEYCSFHDNHRGGIAGGSNNMIIRYCSFSKNDKIPNYSGKTIPLFMVGGTNYHIDFEDSYSKNLKVYGCDFSRSIDTIGKLLFGVYTLEYHDNVSDAPVSIYNNIFSNIHDNQFSSSPVSFSSWRLSDYDEGLKKHGFKYLTRVVLVANNKIKSFPANPTDSHTVLMQFNNYLMR